MSESFKRPNWTEYFMGFAHLASERATCPRLAVGAVIVRGGRLLTTGYNGSVAGTPHCVDDGCWIEDGHCVRVIHAEVNAVLQAAKAGISLKDSACFATVMPCLPCLKALYAAGVKTVIYDADYKTPTEFVGKFIDETQMDVHTLSDSINAENSAVALNAQFNKLFEGVKV